MKFLNYKLFDLHPDKPFEEMSKKEAKAYYDAYTSSIDERFSQFAYVLKINGFDVPENAEELIKFNVWLAANLLESFESYEDFELDDNWLSFEIDLSIYLSEFVIQNTNNVNWVLNSNQRKDDIRFNRPAIAGFSKVRNKKYYVDMWVVVDVFIYNYLESIGNTTDEAIVFALEEIMMDDVEFENTIYKHTESHI